MPKRAYLKQAAIELGLTDYQLRRMAKEHNVPYLLSGTRYIFDVELCLEYLKNKSLEIVKQEQSINTFGVIREIKE